jgi:hypothetical protein
MIEWDTLTAFGLIAVGFTALCYALEGRAPIWTLGFAAGSAFSSVYGFLQGAWPFGVVEIVWTVVALRKWWLLRDFV